MILGAVIHCQLARLERRRAEIKKEEAMVVVEEEAIQILHADLTRKAKVHSERKELLRKEKEEFQHLSAEMLKRQKARG
eukprot:g14053.t1